MAERGLLVQQWQGAPRRSIVKMLAQLDREILTETSDDFSLATPSEAVPPSSARPTVRERRGSIDAESVASSVPASIQDEPAEAAKLDDGQQAGYRETEHVKTYYELARF